MEDLLLGLIIVVLAVGGFMVCLSCHGVPVCFCFDSGTPGGADTVTITVVQDEVNEMSHKGTPGGETTPTVVIGDRNGNGVGDVKVVV